MYLSHTGRLIRFFLLVLLVDYKNFVTLSNYKISNLLKLIVSEMCNVVDPYRILA